MASTAACTVRIVEKMTLGLLDKEVVFFILSNFWLNIIYSLGTYYGLSTLLESCKDNLNGTKLLAAGRVSSQYKKIFSYPVYVPHFQR